MAKILVLKVDVDDIDRRLLRQVLNKLSGTHDVYLDAMEYERVILAGKKDDLKRLILMSEWRLQQSLKRLEKERRVDEPDLDVDLGKAECPQCGKRFNVL